MMHAIRLVGIAAAAAMVAAGCGRTQQPDRPPPLAVSNPPGPETPLVPPPQPTGPAERTTPQRPDVVTGVRPPLKGRLSDEEKQRILEASLLSLQRLVLSAEERLSLSAGAESSNAAKEELATRLSELGFRIVETTSSLGFTPTEATQDVFRTANDCNLAVLVKGEAKETDKFGNFWSFESRLQGKVLNLATHQVIATKTVLKRGKRALDERQAAEDAQEAAARDLATYLTDEVARKWEATSLVRVILVASNIDSAAQADDLRVGLQKRVGIYYVSLDAWDDAVNQAVYEILCRFDVERFLPAYIEELRKGGVEIKKIERRGEVIQARRRHWR